MDEPCSALDPIATAKIEELIDELREQLLHRHRHPLDGPGRARLADAPPSSTWATWSRPGDTDEIFTNPRERRTLTTSPAASAEDARMNQHTVKSYGDELNQLTAEVARMGGLAEAQVADAIDAVARRDVALARAVVERDAKLDAHAARHREARPSA